MTPRFVAAIGLVDGVNRVFGTGHPYHPGTTALYVRGLLRVRTDDDGYVESDPAAGLIELNEAPLPGRPSDPSDPGDRVMIFFLDEPSESGDDTVQAISGTISYDPVEGTIGHDDVGGAIDFPVEVVGSISESSQVSGSVEATEISGTLRVCNG